ncbi:MAG: DUF177 domain-containing protein [Chlamydiae bacterium]|nr:DUF177 domain-containing protein [Chlamydiota bacterium]
MSCIIYADRLKEEQREAIELKLPPDFLQTYPEDEITFKEEILIQGETYLASDHLVIHGSVHTSVLLPCSICNQPVKKTIHINSFYHTEELANIKSHIFDYSEEIRSAILLSIPQFAECNEGRCEERKQMEKFFKKSNITPSHFPFSSLKEK